MSTKKTKTKIIRELPLIEAVEALADFTVEDLRFFLEEKECMEPETLKQALEAEEALLRRCQHDPFMYFRLSAQKYAIERYIRMTLGIPEND